MLTDEEIIKIAADTKTGEPGLHGYILPISFAREIERAVLAKAMQSDADAAFAAHIDERGGEDSYAWHDAPVDGIFKDGFAIGRLAKAMQSQEQSLDEKMKAAGMLSVAELLKGAPLDGFMKHAGVNDLDSLLQWAEMRRGECLRAQAAYGTGSKEHDDMYEWAIAHCAVFTELHVNLRAAIAGEKSKAMPIPKQEPVASRRKDFMGNYVYRNEMILGNDPLYAEPQPAQAAAIPDQPTKEMVIAGINASMEGAPNLNDWDYIVKIYKAMLSASPKPE